MLMRLRAYCDRRRNRIAKEIEEKVAKEIENAKKAVTKEGYEAAKL